MYYTMTAGHEFDEVLRPFCLSQLEEAARSEFQFFSHETQRWIVPSNVRFEFRDLYNISDKLLVLSRKAWDAVAPIIEHDEVFVIPLELSYMGEFRRYYIVIPKRLDCVAQDGSIAARFVGRYHIFRTNGNDSTSVFVTDEVKNRLYAFGQIILKECNYGV